MDKAYALGIAFIVIANIYLAASRPDNVKPIVSSIIGMVYMMLAIAELILSKG